MPVALFTAGRPYCYERTGPRVLHVAEHTAILVAHPAPSLSRERLSHRMRRSTRWPRDRKTSDPTTTC
jgi:hypothetical protein